MATFKNDKFITEFIEQYRENKSPVDIKKIIEYFVSRPIKNSSKVQQLSVLKKLLLNIRQSDELFHLRMPADIATEVKKEQTNSLLKQMDEPVSIRKSKLKKILRMINSNSVHELFIMLLLASGRRPSELYLMANHIPKKGTTENSLIFAHQLKKRKDSNEEYEIPLLISYTDFISSLKKFKSMIGIIPDNNTQIYKKFNKDNGVHFEVINAVLKTNFLSSDLRRLYVSETFKLQSKIKSINKYTMAVLGHDNVITSLNYTNTE